MYIIYSFNKIYICCMPLIDLVRSLCYANRQLEAPCDNLIVPREKICSLIHYLISFVSVLINHRVLFLFFTSILYKKETVAIIKLELYISFNTNYNSITKMQGYRSSTFFVFLLILNVFGGSSPIITNGTVRIFLNGFKYCRNFS